MKELVARLLGVEPRYVPDDITQWDVEVYAWEGAITTLWPRPYGYIERLNRTQIAALVATQAHLMAEQEATVAK